MQDHTDPKMDSKRFQELVEESTFNHGSFADLFTCGVCDMKMWADNIHEHLQSHITVCTNYQFNNETKTIVPVFDNSSVATIIEPVAQKRKLPMPEVVTKKILVKSPRRPTFYGTGAYVDTHTVDEREQRTDLDVENYLNSGTSLTDRLSVLLDQQGGNANEATYFAAKPYPTSIIGPMHQQSEGETNSPSVKKKGKTAKTPKSKSKAKSKKTVGDKNSTKETVPWKSVAPVTSTSNEVGKSEPLRIGETITHIDLPYVVEGKQLGTYHCSVVIEAFTPKDGSKKKARKSIEPATSSSDDAAIEYVNDEEDPEFTATPLHARELQSAVNTITDMLGSPAKSVAIIGGSPVANQSKGKKKRGRKKKEKEKEPKRLTYFRSLNGLRVSCSTCVWTDDHISGLINSELKKSMLHLIARFPTLGLYFESIVEITEFDLYTWAFKDPEVDVLKNVGTEVPELTRLAPERSPFTRLAKENKSGFYSKNDPQNSMIKTEFSTATTKQKVTSQSRTPTKNQKVTSQSPKAQVKTEPSTQSPILNSLLGNLNMPNLGTLNLNPQTNMLNINMNLLASNMYQNPGLIQNFASPYLYYVNQPNANAAQLLQQMAGAVSNNTASSTESSKATDQSENCTAKSENTSEKETSSEAAVATSSADQSKDTTVDNTVPMETDDTIEGVDSENADPETSNKGTDRNESSDHAYVTKPTKVATIDKTVTCNTASSHDNVSHKGTVEKEKEKSGENCASEVDKTAKLQRRQQVIFDAKTKKKYTVTYLNKSSDNELPKLIEKEDGTVEIDESLKSLTKTIGSPGKKSKYIVYVRKTPAGSNSSETKSEVLQVKKVPADSVGSAKATNKVKIKKQGKKAVDNKSESSLAKSGKVTGTGSIGSSSSITQTTTTPSVSNSPMMALNSLINLQQPTLQMPTGYMPLQHNFVPANTQGLFIYNNTLFQHTPFPVAQPSLLAANMPQLVVPQLPSTTLATSAAESSSKGENAEQEKDKGKTEQDKDKNENAEQNKENGKAEQDKENGKAELDKENGKEDQDKENGEAEQDKKNGKAEQDKENEKIEQDKDKDGKAEQEVDEEAGQEKDNDKARKETKEKSDDKEQKSDEMDEAIEIDDQTDDGNDGVQDAVNISTVTSSLNQAQSDTDQALISKTSKTLKEVMPGKTITKVQLAKPQQKNGTQGTLQAKLSSDVSVTKSSKVDATRKTPVGKVKQESDISGNIYERDGECKYICEICLLDLETKDSLDAHNAETHTYQEILENYLALYSLYVCVGCGFSKKDKRLFQQHVAKCVSAAKCGFDKFDTNSYKNYAHLTSKVTKFKCEYCDFVTINSHMYSGHPYKCANWPTLKCEMCNFETVKEKDLGVHKLNVHNVKAYKCETCDRLFSTPQALSTHVGIKHLKNTARSRPKEQFVCDKCGKVCMGRQGYEMHVKLKHAQITACLYCDMQFLYGAQCQIHEGTHTGDFRHSCVTCQKVFPSVKSYYDHMTYKHKLERELSTKMNKMLRRLRGLIFTNICRFCHESFQDENMFVSHMKARHEMNTDQAKKSRLDALKVERLIMYQRKLEVGDLKETGAQVKVVMVQKQVVRTTETGIKKVETETEQL